MATDPMILKERKRLRDIQYRALPHIAEKKRIITKQWRDNPINASRISLHKRDYRTRYETDPMFRQREQDRQYRRREDPAEVQRQMTSARRTGPKNSRLNKEAVINVYTNGEATCRHCGHGDMDVLCLDHIDDSGAEHRKSLGHIAYSGAAMHTWVIANDYPPIFQVLCANCNLKKEVLRRRAARREHY